MATTSGLDGGAGKPDIEDAQNLTNECQSLQAETRELSSQMGTYNAPNDDIVINGKLPNGEKPAPDSADDEQQRQAGQGRGDANDERALVLVSVAGIRLDKGVVCRHVGRLAPSTAIGAFVRVEVGRVPSRSGRAMCLISRR